MRGVKGVRCTGRPRRRDRRPPRGTRAARGARPGAQHPLWNAAWTGRRTDPSSPPPKFPKGLQTRGPLPPKPSLLPGALSGSSRPPARTQRVGAAPWVTGRCCSTTCCCRGEATCVPRAARARLRRADAPPRATGPRAAEAVVQRLLLAQHRRRQGGERERGRRAPGPKQARRRAPRPRAKSRDLLPSLLRRAYPALALCSRLAAARWRRRAARQRARHAKPLPALTSRVARPAQTSPHLRGRASRAATSCR